MDKDICIHLDYGHPWQFYALVDEKGRVKQSAYLNEGCQSVVRLGSYPYPMWIQWQGKNGLYKVENLADFIE